MGGHEAVDGGNGSFFEPNGLLKRDLLWYLKRDLILARRKSDGTAPALSRFARCDPSWLQLGLSGRELRVLLALSLHADWSKGFGRCFARRDALASETRLQVSHVSEAVRELAYKHRLITVVRIGRKNVYYIREIGATSPMPPSDPEPFFEYLGRLGIRLRFTLFPLGFHYHAGSRTFDEFPGILAQIFSDYMSGATASKLERWALRRTRSL